GTSASPSAKWWLVELEYVTPSRRIWVFRASITPKEERRSKLDRRSSTAVMTSARGPIAAKLWRYAVLRRALGWRRTASEMAPISDGSAAGSMIGSASASWTNVNVGATSVPRGP